jgi:predicted dehydrogenase
MAIKLGMVDFDSSHCVEFTRRINHVGIAEDQCVDGARVVMGCPGTSRLSPERVSGFTEEMRTLGVTLVDRPDEMIGKVDAVMIESVDGSVHWERTRPFLDAGALCWVDKPFTCSLEEAKAMVDLADRRRVPIFSSSSLRYAPEVVRFVAECAAKDSAMGAILGATVYGPSPTHARNPGLFHYGIHATEVLFTLMGDQCECVTCLRVGGDVGSETTGVDVVTGNWSGGRVGSVRGIRSGAAAYGFVAFCEKGVRHVPISTQYVYRELLKQVIRMFETREPPVDPVETLQIIAFIEASRDSGTSGGTPRRAS